MDISLISIKRTNYKIIFTGYVPFTKKPKGLSFAAQGIVSQEKFASSVFYQYPNITGQKWIYLIYNSTDDDANIGSKPFSETNPNAPEPQYPKKSD